MALLSQLPECLHALDPDTLMMLVQDERNMATILNADGSVNPTKVDMLRRGQILLPSAGE